MTRQTVVTWAVVLVGAATIVALAGGASRDTARLRAAADSLDREVARVSALAAHRAESDRRRTAELAERLRVATAALAGATRRTDAVLDSVLVAAPDTCRSAVVGIRLQLAVERLRWRGLVEAAEAQTGEALRQVAYWRDTVAVQQSAQLAESRRLLQSALAVRRPAHGVRWLVTGVVVGVLVSR